MSGTVIGKGKTIDDAVNQALTELGLTKEEVEVKVVEYPENGVFGLFGKKEAVVEVTPINNNNIEKTAETFLMKMFNAMDLPAELTIRTEDNTLYIDISGEHMGILIGRRGQTLDSIQYLTSLVVNRHQDDYVRVIIDTENYREKRKNVLEGVAQKTAAKVVRYHKRLALEPMNPSERRIIHSMLQNHPKVYTYSEGEEPYRYVVIDLK